MTTKLIFLIPTIAFLLGCSSDTATIEPSQQAPAAVSERQQAPSPTEGTSDFTHIITTDTVYYEIGPQQAQPPDGTLKAGTKVNVVREAGSYCRVESEDGVVGLVEAGAVKEVGDNR